MLDWANYELLRSIELRFCLLILFLTGWILSPSLPSEEVLEVRYMEFFYQTYSTTGVKFTLVEFLYTEKYQTTLLRGS
jgi:hypothetical protein